MTDNTKAAMSAAEIEAFNARRGIEGRFAGRAWQAGDPVAPVGGFMLVSGANADVESDQQRSYLWREVIGYSFNNEFVCLQTSGCWPTVERMAQCWVAEIRVPLASPQGPKPDGVVEAKKNGFFAFDSDEGFHTYDTADEAKKAAKEAIREWRVVSRNDGEWPLEVDSVCWGIVCERAEATKPDEEGGIDYALLRHEAAGGSKLHDAIMNIEIGSDIHHAEPDERWMKAYTLGHRDARHAAAELALASTGASQEGEQAGGAVREALAGRVMKWLDDNCKRVAWSIEDATYEITDSQAIELALLAQKGQQ